MKQRTKLTQKQEHVAEQQTQAHATLEFSNSDELLRFDAAQTVVPPEIAERLKESAAKMPPPAPPPPWWRRFLGGIL